MVRLNVKEEKLTVGGKEFHRMTAS